MLFSTEGGREGEERRERKDKEGKTVTGQTNIQPNQPQPFRFYWSALEANVDLLILFVFILGARSLVGNQWHNFTTPPPPPLQPSRKMAHYLFPNPMAVSIFTVCDCTQETQRLGCCGDRPFCGWGELFKSRLNRKCLLICENDSVTHLTRRTSLGASAIGPNRQRIILCCFLLLLYTGY